MRRVVLLRSRSYPAYPEPFLPMSPADPARGGMEAGQGT